jgi:hypothetical protein
MLRPRHQYRLLTAAFLFALVGVAFFAGYAGMRSSDSHAPQYQTAQPPPQAPGYYIKEPEGFWERATTDPVAIVTLALVIVTAFMTRAIFAQVSLARDDFIATHRPELLVREVSRAIGETGDDGKNGKWSIVFTIVNRGRNQCEIVESVFRYSTTPGNGQAERTWGKNELGRWLFAAGEFHTFVHPMVSPLEQLVANQHAKTGGPTGEDYFVGTIIYADKAGIRRRYAFVRVCKSGDRFFPTGNPEDEYTD